MKTTPISQTPAPILGPAFPLQPRDLEKFRISGDTSPDSIKLPIAPSVRKPSKVEWFRTHPDDKEWFPCLVHVDESDFAKTTYLVSSEIASMLGAVVTQVLVIPCQNLTGDLFFWPMKTVSNAWSDSAHAIAVDARTAWRRMEPNMVQRCYQGYAPISPRPDPSWADLTALQQMMMAAFGERLITSESHPIVAKLLLA